jgi:hypothetical protein
MAISPEKLNEAFQKEVDILESILDQKLSKQKIAKGGSVTIGIPEGMSESHFEILRTRYISAGWTSIKLNSVLLEGTWITFHY